TLGSRSAIDGSNLRRAGTAAAFFRALDIGSPRTHQDDLMGLKKTPRFFLLTVGYAVLIQVSYVAALLLRFEGEIPPRFWSGYLDLAAISTLLSLIGFFLAGLYHGLWRYASTVTLFQVIKGVTLSALSLAIIMFFTPTPLFPRSILVMVWLNELVLLGGVRFAWRLSRERVPGPGP